MKNNKIIIIILVLVICFVMIGLLTFVGKKDKYSLSGDKSSSVIFNIVKHDNQNDTTIIDNNYSIKKGSIIKLNNKEEYKDCGKYANDIKIEEINEDYVKISRDKLIYSQSGNRTERVEENIKYDTMLELYLFEKEETDSVVIEPECSQARYNYYGMFKKGN
ncbi:MAG: hypothetical protein VZS44_06785 [Bacilli bacterium]|nr:hypothetical protein [Bacilli bacterium]